MKRYIFSTILILSTFLVLNAQKFGYLNTTQLLISMPEIKAADAELEAFQTVLISKGTDMVKKYEAAYQTYMEKVNLGQLSQIQMQQEEAKLVNQQQEIQDYQTEVQQTIQQKKQDLYQPVLKKVQEAVDQVGKELGYTMIFDASIGGMLFATEADDLMSLIKQRMGL